jgi:hypothetical protein
MLSRARSMDGRTYLIAGFLCAKPERYFRGRMCARRPDNQWHPTNPNNQGVESSAIGKVAQPCHVCCAHLAYPKLRRRDRKMWLRSWRGESSSGCSRTT